MLLPVLKRNSKKADPPLFIKKRTRSAIDLQSGFFHMLLSKHGLHESCERHFIGRAHRLACRVHGEDWHADIHRADGNERRGNGTER